MNLSPRQLQILERISEGKKRTVIAAELNLSLGTVNDYTNRIYKRLDSHTGAEALAKYLRWKHAQLTFF